eukprot:TRINITY_DN20780_c0_g1_i2.p1 TRINITY_DN20780_c0_g1~~TRINITY_DN20780_c0_g1_i2.p1  ORF type:complete len:380 (+),score=120.09 TRINITY_DN20780_c0_g1_i2:61-1140(+)
MCIRDRYKADVFSLGVTLLELTVRGDVQEIYNPRTNDVDAERIDQILKSQVAPSYSQLYTKTLREMLEVDEVQRPDFLQLDRFLRDYRPKIAARQPFDERKTPMQAVSDTDSDRYTNPYTIPKTPVQPVQHIKYAAPAIPAPQPQYQAPPPQYQNYQPPPQPQYQNAPPPVFNPVYQGPPPQYTPPSPPSNRTTTPSTTYQPSPPPTYQPTYQPQPVPQTTPYIPPQVKEQLLAPSQPQNYYPAYNSQPIVTPSPAPTTPQYQPQPQVVRYTAPPPTTTIPSGNGAPITIQGSPAPQSTNPHSDLEQLEERVKNALRRSEATIQKYNATRTQITNYANAQNPALYISVFTVQDLSLIHI